MLGELVFAAMKNEEFGVEFDPALTDIWRAFGAPPRPAFLLDIPLRLESPLPKVPTVREGVTVEGSAAVAIHGLVMGPNSIPIMGARVEYPFLNLSTQSDSHGRFYFSVVPAKPAPEFKVTAKGKVLTIRADEKSLSGEALLIHFENLE